MHSRFRRWASSTTISRRPWERASISSAVASNRLQAGEAERVSADSNVVATRRIVGWLGKDSEQASIVGDVASASSTGNVLPVPASPCTAPIAAASCRSVTVRRVSRYASVGTVAASASSRKWQAINCSAPAARVSRCGPGATTAHPRGGGRLRWRGRVSPQLPRPLDLAL